MPGSRTKRQAYHYPAGDPKAEDPLGDGFHTWHSGQEVIGPATIVDEAVILLGGRHSLFCSIGLADHGYLSVPPVGSPGLPTRPSIQVAAKGLHYAHDTLCLMANDAAGLERDIEALLGDLPDPQAPPAAALRRRASRSKACKPTADAHGDRRPGHQRIGARTCNSTRPAMCMPSPGDTARTCTRSQPDGSRTLQPPLARDGHQPAERVCRPAVRLHVGRCPALSVVARQPAAARRPG